MVINSSHNTGTEAFIIRQALQTWCHFCSWSLDSLCLSFVLSYVITIAGVHTYSDLGRITDSQLLYHFHIQISEG